LFYDFWLDLKAAIVRETILFMGWAVMNGTYRLVNGMFAWLFLAF